MQFVDESTLDELIPVPENQAFGRYGGQFVGESLMEACLELERSIDTVFCDPGIRAEMQSELKEFVGRPTPLTYAKRLSERIGGAKIFLKREDLLHTGAHKINNVVGQMILARHLGRKRIVAETGAGQHGVATATYAARLGLECVIYMGAKDIARQLPNVQRMKLLGAKVVSVETGEKTLKDAINEALRDWVSDPRSTHYLIGSVLGPHPYPKLVASLQSVIGEEAREQVISQSGRLPDAIVACVGGGSNAIGIFSGFMDEASVELVGVEAENAARLQNGTVGIFQGTKTMLLQDTFGNTLPTSSIAPGLDYAGVGPEHSALVETGRARYTTVTDEEALEAFRLLSRFEGIIPALESAHALSFTMKKAASLSPDKTIIANISGRGDKDLPQFFARENQI